MFNKILWILGPIALLYVLFLSMDDASKGKSLTAESIKFTQDICLPTMALEGPVESRNFQTALTKIIPSEYTLEQGKIPVGPIDVCAPYWVVKDGTPVRVSLCQDTSGNLRCNVATRARDGSLKARKYLSSISELSGWKSHYPNRNRPKGEPNSTVSGYLCRPMSQDDAANAVAIRRGSYVTLYEAECSQLADMTR